MENFVDSNIDEDHDNSFNSSTFLSTFNSSSNEERELLVFDLLKSYTKMNNNIKLIQSKNNEMENYISSIENKYTELEITKNSFECMLENINREVLTTNTQTKHQINSYIEEINILKNESLKKSNIIKRRASSSGGLYYIGVAVVVFNVAYTVKSILLNLF